MTFQQLHYLLEVNKVGSFSTAARNLYVSQSAVSNAIIGLEKELGASLFVRGQKLLVPTARGKEVIEHATHIFERFHSITNPKQPQKTEVRIGSIGYAPANKAFVRLLDENKNRTDIDFSFVDTRSGPFLSRLLGQELDLALFFNLSTYSNYLLESFHKHNLSYQLLANVPAVVCIGPGHRLYSQEEIHMSEFRNDRLLDTEKDGFASIGVMPAYLPISRDNVLVACGKDVRHEILMNGHAYSIQYMPSKEYRSTSPLRYIPIGGLNYAVYAATNPTIPHCDQVDRYLTLLKEEIAEAELC